MLQIHIDMLRRMMNSYDVRYIVIKTKFTTHHLEKLMPTCKDRGTWKWIAETNSDAFDNMGDPGGEARLSCVDGGDLFPRLYFLRDSFINEFNEWLKMRNLNVTEIEVPLL